MFIVRCFILAAGMVSTQAVAGDVLGTVTDRGTGKAITGAHVAVKGTAIATPTDSLGGFALRSLPGGQYSIRVSFVGYEATQQEITVPGSGSVRMEFVLSPAILPVQPITVTATRGKERETPATFSTLDYETLRDRYAVQRFRYTVARRGENVDLFEVLDAHQ